MSKIQIGRVPLKRNVVKYEDVPVGACFLISKGGGVNSRSLCIKVDAHKHLISKDHGVADCDVKHMIETEMRIEEMRGNPDVELPELVSIAWR